MLPESVSALEGICMGIARDFNAGKKYGGRGEKQTLVDWL